MDDAKIDQIAREVLTSLKKARAEGASCTPEASAPVRGETKPFHLHLLSVSGGVVGSPCAIEPDKPCVGSLKCRSLGH